VGILGIVPQLGEWSFLRLRSVRPPLSKATTGPEARALFAASFAYNLGAAMAGLAAILLAIRLEATPLELGLIGMIWPAFYTVACLFSGPLSDRVSRRLLCSIGCAIACSAYLLMMEASSPRQIMLFGFPVGIAMSLFWPPLEAWLAELSSPADLRRNFGVFNIAWSAGAAPGPFLAGVAINVGVPFAFVSSVSFMAIAGVIVMTRRPDVRRDANTRRPLTADEDSSRRYLHLAWVANFGTYFTIGIIRSLFPKLGGELGMSSPSIGSLLSTITFTQVLMFALLRRTSIWHYRIAPLLVSQFILLAGSLLIYTGTRFEGFLLPMVMAGGCAGISYFSSIYYSINTPVRLGARSGLHESLIGLGVVAGPLTGGIVAQRWGLRSPYLLSAAVTLLGIGCLACVGIALRTGRKK